MKIDDAKKSLGQLFRGNHWLFKQFTATMERPYDVRAEYGSVEIPYASENGVYLYTSRDGAILYIGKGDQRAGEGIGREACRHLGRRQTGSNVMFPDHDWVDASVPDEIKSTIACGEFLMYTVKVEPSVYAVLVEIVLQLCCQTQDGKLPPLNSRVG